MDYRIEYHSEEVEEQIFALPDTLAARFIVRIVSAKARVD